jgi:uncharacterized membrane protein (DUF106 family)
MVNGVLIVAGSALGLSLLTIVINKLLINEKLVDNTKVEMSNIQKELKGMDSKSKEFQNKQEKILDMNMVIMKQQFKPMFATFLPYIIGFYLLGAMFSYSIIDIGSEVKFDVKGNALIESTCLDLNKTISGKETFKAVVNSNDCKFLVNGKDSGTNLIGVKTITNLKIDDTTITITPTKQVLINLPFSIPAVGNKLGWLGTLVISSFVTSMILNKALKGVYLRKWE